MYALPIQGEDEKKGQEEHSTSGSRLPVYENDNDIYSSEKRLTREEYEREKQLRKLKDGQEVFTSSQSIHRDDFIAVSLPKEEKKIEEEEEEVYTPLEESPKRSKKKSKSSRSSKYEDKGAKKDRSDNNTVNQSAYETKWDS